MLAGEVPRDGVSDADERIHLSSAQDVGEAVADRRDVLGGSVANGSQPSCGEDDVEAPGVAFARGAAHSAAALHSSDLVRESAALPPELATEVPSSDPV